MKVGSRYAYSSLILIMLIFSAGVYVIDSAPAAAQSRQYSSGGESLVSSESRDATTNDKSKPFSNSRENLIFVAGEISGSDSIIYRLGGLADPTTVQLSDDFEDSEKQSVAVSGNNVFVVWDSDSTEIL